jgi:Fic family protein
MDYSFSYSKYIVNLIRDIERELAQIDLNPSDKNLEIQLRRKNQIQTITGTCQIEGNTLSKELVTDILSGKRVVGSDKEIIEVKNASELYESLETFNPESKKIFLQAHKILLNKLNADAGKIRKVNVGVGNQQSLKYIAPNFKVVPTLLDNLFKQLKSPLFDEITTSALVHLEIESIHPFSDGNGRIGRFWQTLYLAKKVNLIFQFLNIEGLIKENQDQYYAVLIKSQSNKNSNFFVEFILKLILESLVNYRSTQKIFSNGRNRVISVKQIFKKRLFSRLEYMKEIGVTSSATATRDLTEALENGILIAVGKRNQTRYRFK